MLLALQLKLCCVCLVTIASVLGHNSISDQDAHAAIMKAITQAQAELNIEKEVNEKMFQAKIDGTPRERCPFKQMTNSKPPQVATPDPADVGFIIYRATQILSQMFGKTVDQLKAHKNVQTIWQAKISNICSKREPRCQKTMFRTMDGSCNNLQHPTWGMAGRPYKRYLPSAYKDGVSMPRMLSVTGGPLPSARFISNVVHQNFYKSVATERKDSAMVMVYGVLFAIGSAATPSARGHKGVTPNCCNTPPEFLKKRSSCFSIAVPFGDKHFVKCMSFSRASAYAKDDCQFCQRQQGNGATGYIDASWMYGNSDSDVAGIRKFRRGLMKLTGFGLPPPAEDQTKCIREKYQDYCMKGGDPKIQLVPPLTAIITVYLRYHNRIALKLARLNPHWSDERIFQETRKIVIAVHQHIGYNEYLPYILGPHYMKKYQLYSSKRGYIEKYDANVDATTTNAYSAAAFRFGHSQIPNAAGVIYKNGKRMDAELKDFYFRPGPMTADGPFGPDNINRWIMTVNGARSDRIVESAARDYMLLDEFGNSFDLAAYNIQRGRDHGLPGYNKWRKFCGLAPAHHFGPGKGGLVHINPYTAKLLSKVYRGVTDDIDLFTGGLSEYHVRGARVGPTFACIIGKQLHDLKFGDRFWYENRLKTGFKPGQLHEIKKIRLSSVMCMGMKEYSMQPNVFKIPSWWNPRISCNKLPHLNLLQWKERRRRKPYWGRRKPYWGGRKPKFS